MAKHRIQTILDQRGGKCTDRFGLIEDFGKPQKSEDSNVTEYPGRLKVRDGGVINHPWFGRIVNDFAGMQWHKEKLILDWNHDTDEEIGVIDTKDSSSGNLICLARIFSRNAEDRAAKIKDYADAGMPYEVSMTWGATQDGRFVVEDIPANKTAMVNDREVKGPVSIIRVWGMYGAAICHHGVDSSTSTEIEDTEGKNMPKDLKIFIDKFGSDMGLKLMLDDSVTTLEDAETKFKEQRLSQLTTDNKTLTDANIALTQELTTIKDSLTKMTDVNTQLAADNKRLTDENLKYKQALPGITVTDAKVDSSNRKLEVEPDKKTYRDAMANYFNETKK